MDFIHIVRLFTVTFASLIAVHSLPWHRTSFQFWFIFCIPLLVYYGILALSKMLERFKEIHPLIPQYVEMFVFQTITIFLVYLTGGESSSFKTIYLLPVVLYSLHYGSKIGYISAIINSVAILNFYLVRPDMGLLEVDFVLILSFFCFSWLIGNVVAQERFTRKQLAELVNRDELTGAYNYRYFQYKLVEYTTNYEKQGNEKLGLILLDLDNFRLYNEIFGYLSGDSVLRKVKKIIEHYLEERDLLARYGADSFVILTWGHETSQIIAKAEKIRKGISSLQNVIPGHDLNVSASLGIALFPDQAEDTKSLLKKADEALYKAKMARGNRVQLYYSIFDRISGDKPARESNLLDTIKTLMAVVHAKDKFTYGHSERVLVYAQLICRSLKLPAREVTWVEYAALLHDVGKIEISKEILNEPGPLSPEKWDIFKQHPLWSAEIIKSLDKMEPLLPIIKHHHERFDGKGYPSGLRGDEIPLGARILAVANVFDLLTSGRKNNGKTLAEGLDFLINNKGTFFDPQIVDSFASCLEEYKSISGVLEWPKDLCKLVPAGYFPGYLLTGGHYVELYTGNVHLAVKAIAYCAAGVTNNEKILYYLDEETEKIFLDRLAEYSYNGLAINSLIKENQLIRWEHPEELFAHLNRRAKLEFETKKFLKTTLDRVYKEKYSSLRIILDASAFSVTPNKIKDWENNLSRCLKDLDITLICFYDFIKVPLETCRMLYTLHDRPLYKEEDDNKINP